MKCYSRKYGVYVDDNYFDVVGMAFIEFDDHGTERLFCLDDVSFTPVDKLTKGKML